VERNASLVRNIPEVKERNEGVMEKDPWLESIRGEERFKKLMERVKQEWEEFEV
jgi:hypothetical protein